MRLVNIPIGATGVIGPTGFGGGRDETSDFTIYMFLQTMYWRTLRHIVFVRDKWLCRYCGDDWCSLEVHHTTYKNHGAEHLYLSDLKTACENCHAKISAIESFGINYETEILPRRCEGAAR